MSLWDGIMTVVGAVSEAAKKRHERILRYKELFRNHDDEFLRRKFKTGSTEERIACKALLEERGYTFSYPDKSE